MYKIYKHTCKINNKSYIGQTCKPEAKYRWGKNGAEYNRQPKFWRAIQKYGWDNFTHEVLKNNIETAEDATYWEAYYIAKYDSINTGYNIREAGINGAMTSLYKPVYQYDLDGKLIAIYSSGVEAENKTGILRSDISACASNNKHTAGGYVWRYEDEEFSLPEKQTTAVEIDQFSLQGDFIKTWPSMASIYKNMGIRQGNIYACCKGLRPYAGGYKWKYHLKESIDMENKTQLANQIECIDDFITRIYELRRQGLQATNGEFSIQNLVFKELRNKGYLDNLRDLKNKLKSKDFSLK